jgi:(E)-4-hydroxy-3-methylbut-2-enyl-diphosphate synthase
MKKKRCTREVLVGKIGVGNKNPIRIQSMTTTDTKDVSATVDQIKKLADLGCEIARVTVQGKKEALATESIKNKLLQADYTIPLVADIHFYPPAAMLVAEFVDKVRINPGNFADRRATFKVLEYTDESYQLELEKIEEKFAPLILKCKKLKKSLRIGVNHGSLSDRIMNRFGDTPAGMVESAIEYTRIARKYDYHEIIFSMKSSNPTVMLSAYRLLVEKLDELNWDYPLHLGVTEAGYGFEGRIKSSAGIGALLLDGIGNTIRVSLTEDPTFEIDPCKRLINFAEDRSQFTLFSPYQRTKLVSHPFLHQDGTVILKISKDIDLKQLSKEIYPDIIWTDSPNQKLLEKSKAVGIKIISSDARFSDLQLFSMEELPEILPEFFAIQMNSSSENYIEKLKEIKPQFIIWSLDNEKIRKTRAFFHDLKTQKIDIPIILDFIYQKNIEDTVIQFATEAGSLLCDGIGDGVSLQVNHLQNEVLSISFNILQAARMRAVKTEFISCPSCGRTLFDLQDTAMRIREKTSHLPGVKIAIMGCIVNGPGEMADADFGYVGSKPDKVDLYVGKKCVIKDIHFSEADDRLIELIKEHGLWVDVDNLDKDKSHADIQLV